MHIDPLEKKWLYVTLGMISLFLGAIFLTALVGGIHPPSNVETIDSARLHLSEEFAEDKLGVKLQPDGSIKVVMVAGRYGFFPRHIILPADTPVAFRWASVDVLRGVHMPMTNMSTMVVPGYVAEVTTEFPIQVIIPCCATNTAVSATISCGARSPWWTNRLGRASIRPPDGSQPIHIRRNHEQSTHSDCGILPGADCPDRLGDPSPDCCP